MKNLALAVWLLVGIAVAEQHPKTMTKMEVVLQSPDAPADSFAAKPRTIYRAGTGYCRIEEAPDPNQGIHGLTIINEPDVWMINQFGKTGQHIVDPGPTFNCRLPIFVNGVKVTEGENKDLSQLEFGRELEFFKEKGSIGQKGPVLQTKETTAYRVNIGSSELALFTYGTPERPLGVARVNGDKRDIYWYSGYGEIDFDPKLFAKPDNFKIQDAKP